MRRFAVAAVAAAIAVSGCGSSDDHAKKQYVADANTICKLGREDVSAIGRQVAKAQQGSDPKRVFAEISVLTERGGRAYSHYVDELDALVPPAKDRDRIKAWIAVQRQQIALIQTLARAYNARDEGRIARLSEQIDALGQRSDTFARDYGMTACARPTTS
jgi:hypothetical protein